MAETQTSEPDNHVLIDEITQLPVRPGASMQLMWMLDDPDSSAADLGALIEADPALSTQVIRLANSPFYGLSRRVTSAWRAVTVLGYATVRALAISAAFDLFAEKGKAVPDGFWDHSILSAASASALARRVGVTQTDAFSTGLLLDLGMALMHRRARPRYDLVMARVAAGECPLVVAEREEFGITHADIGSLALEKVNFPPELVAAIAAHHSSISSTDEKLVRIAVAADAISREIEGNFQESSMTLDKALELFEFDGEARQLLVEEVKRDAENLGQIFNLS